MRAPTTRILMWIVVVALAVSNVAIGARADAPSMSEPCDMPCCKPAPKIEPVAEPTFCCELEEAALAPAPEPAKEDHCACVSAPIKHESPAVVAAISAPDFPAVDFPTTCFTIIEPMAQAIVPGICAQDAGPPGDAFARHLASRAPPIA